MRSEPSSKKITWTRENVGYRALATGKRSYCYRYRDADAIQRCPFLGPGSTEKQAIAALANVTVAALRGDAIRVSREPFTSFAERWLNDREADLAPSTIRSYRWHYEHFIKRNRHFRKSISKISSNDVAGFILDLKNYRRGNGKPLTGWTIRGAVAVLSGVLGEAVDQGFIASNPVHKVAKKKREKITDEMAKRVLSVEEINRLIAAAEDRGLRWAVLIGLGVYAGLRLGEAVGLRWQDVDLDSGVIRIRKQRDAKTGTLRELKTRAAKREIPISTPLRRLLVEWKLNSGCVANDDHVITTVAGSSVSQRNALRTLCEVAFGCGINAPNDEETEEEPNLDFHSLRHTFASAMIKATKGDAEKVRRWMGHADTKVLLERYSHEFDTVRGGRPIEEEIAEMDGAYGVPSAR